MSAAHATTDPIVLDESTLVDILVNAASAATAKTRLAGTALPVTRHSIGELFGGAWARRGELRLV